MAWDDFGDYNSGDFGSFDAFSGGSYSPQDYAGFSLGGGYQPQMQQPFSLGGGMGQPQMGGMPPQGMGGTMSPQGGLQGQPQFSLPPAQAPQQGGAGGLMGALPGILGAGGGLASVIGQLVGGGQGPQQQRTLNNAGQGAMGSANSMNANAATGQLPLQQMQMSLLQALQSGQGLPPGYQQLIEQAFQPQMGDLYTQAAQMGQSRGFHDAPATSPPGGAILGPGLSNLQGQMAQAKLGLMQSLPQTFQAPINSQLGALGTNSQSLTNTAMMNSGSQQQQTNAPMIGNQIGSILQGAGQAMNMRSTASLGGSPQKFAKGGVVTKPTHALIGEAGPEAVVPLSHGPQPAAAPAAAGAPPGLMQLIMSLLARSQAMRATNLTMHGQPQKFGQGGVVTQPTNAIIGDAGPEAVIPLQMPQPNQPPVDQRSLAQLMQILGILPTPERQQQLGSR